MTWKAAVLDDSEGSGLGQQGLTEENLARQEDKGRGLERPHWGGEEACHPTEVGLAKVGKWDETVGLRGGGERMGPTSIRE